MITENQIRRTSIGGSDVLRLMDGDWNPLWMEKLGYKEPDDLSDVFPVQLGIFTEPFNVRMFARTCKSRCKSRCVTTVCWVKCHAAQRWMVSLCIG